MRADDFVNAKSKIDYDIIDDIHAYMTNDNEFYRRNYFPVIDEYKSKGKTDKMLPMIELACNEYFEKFNVPARQENAINDNDKQFLMDKIIEGEKEEKDE
jgi:hypothetical protein|tara:strand:+ start:474 stop:773 length:300 start_codon:yes stop_codon:yes gene_type:complete